MRIPRPVDIQKKCQNTAETQSLCPSSWNSRNRLHSSPETQTQTFFDRMINLYAPGGDFCGAGTKAKSVWHVTEMRGQDHEEGMVVSGQTDGLTDFGNMQPEWANKVFPDYFFHSPNGFSSRELFPLWPCHINFLAFCQQLVKKKKKARERPTFPSFFV